ncbi:hypothetical protein [Empedobacter tilapiae]|uniref:Uncharacterized protein n=1 Tax=Empedobacter tilapiae TaxID=2491114 RepID=A0A4Z1B1H3_9FLAO|nr:hypothetical protein [Empedobacter tilapiae]TGN27073.1 hypothetical protein E4J94_07580 [Empedobacter tilapiae]
MTTAKEIIKKYKIKTELDKSFSDLLNSNSCEDLNINNKEISINTANINYNKTTLNFHLFKTPILEKNNEIGYYALEYDSKFQLIDNYFVIN